MTKCVSMTPAAISLGGEFAVIVSPVATQSEPLRLAMASGEPIKALVLDAKYMHNDYCFERDDWEPRSGERPRTVLGFSSFGGSEMPSNTLFAG